MSHHTRQDPAAATSDSFQASLRAKGFEPGEPVHEYHGCFTKEQLQDSLFGSTYSTVVPVHLSTDDDTVRIPVVITHAQARYEPYAPVIGATPAGSYEQPDWYLEGWVVKSGFDAFDGITHVRIHVSDGFEDGAFLWQVIPTKPVDRNEPIQVVTD